MTEVLANVDFDEESGEYILNFPDDLIKKYGLEEGDKVEYNITEDGSVTIKIYDGVTNEPRLPVGGEVSTKDNTTDNTSQLSDDHISRVYKSWEDS